MNPQIVDLGLARRVRDEGLRPVANPLFRRLALGFDSILLVAEVLGRLLVERGSQHVLGEQLQQTVRAGQRQPLTLASVTIAVAAACSADSPVPASGHSYLDSQDPMSSLTVPIPPDLSPACRVGNTDLETVPSHHTVDLIAEHEDVQIDIAQLDLADPEVYDMLCTSE